MTTGRHEKTIVFWGLSLAGITAPIKVAGAIITVAGFTVGYLVPADRP